MKALEWGIYLIIFFLPLYLIKFAIFGIPTTILELMIYGLFLIWLAQNKLQGIKDIVIKLQDVVLPIILILIGVSLATVFSWDIRTSSGILKAWFIDPILFLVVFIGIIKKPEQVRRVFFSLIFSGFIVSLISLIYLVQGKLDVQGRLQGFYNSPNYLAMYLAPILVIGLGMIFLEKGYLSKRSLAVRAGMVSDSDIGGARTRKSAATRWVADACLWINTLFLITVLIFTKSYGAWIGIFMGLIAGIIFFTYKKKPIISARLILGVLLLVLIIISIFAYFKINTIQGKLSLESRLYIWQRAWQAFKHYPVIGIGPGTFGSYFPPYPRWGVPQPHNIYLAFLIQTGIFGFIGFVWLLLWLFKTGFRLLVADYWLLVTILLSVMTYILAHGLIDTTYWKNDLSLIFWLFIGTMIILKNPR